MQDFTRSLSRSRRRFGRGLFARWLGPTLRAGRLASPEEARCMLPPRELSRLGEGIAPARPARRSAPPGPGSARRPGRFG
jgi:hypothetical protein